MIENVVRHIGGVEIFGIISVSLFFAFFAGMLLWVARIKKPYLSTMRELPLDDGSKVPARSDPKTEICHE